MQSVTHTARGSENTSAWMCIIRSPPAAYSITKHTCSLVWKQAKRLTRNGCRTLFTVSKILFSHIRLRRSARRAQRVIVRVKNCYTLNYLFQRRVQPARSHLLQLPAILQHWQINDQHNSHCALGSSAVTTLFTI